MSQHINRRHLLAGSIALTTAACGAVAVRGNAIQENKPTTDPNLDLRKGDAPWPVWNATEETGLTDTLNSGRWGRLTGKRVLEFEQTWSEKMNAKYCIATSSGTTALLASMGALNIGPGDEVILPPYTFVATFNVITNSFALPIFVDSDLESFQIDGTKVSAAITDNTKLMIPVHIGGSPCNLDSILEISRQKKIPFIEDACQAHLAGWRGRGVGTHGLGGCFSFQASKNLNAGEGGAIVTNDQEFANLCYNFHTPGNPRPAASSGRGANFRMTEFQGSLLLSQFQRLEEQAQKREENAKYLNQVLAQIPGIYPAKLYEGTDRSAWHLYMFRFDQAKFGKLNRNEFISALSKHGIQASRGYTPLNSSSHVQALASNPHYQKIYGQDFMQRWVERNQCPVNDQLCSQAVWFTQNILLGQRTEMEQIASTIDAIRQTVA